MLKLYPRGFLYCPSGLRSCPDHYIPAPVLPGLYYDPEFGCEASESDGAVVAVLGTCISIDPHSLSVADELLTSLKAGEDALLRRLDRFSGRHVVLFRSSAESPVRILGDAACVRTIFFAEGVAAAHVPVVNANRESPTDPIDFIPQWGYPGALTSRPGIRILTPNLLLDTSTWTVHRFYPRGPLKKRPVEEAAQLIAAAVINGLTHFRRSGRNLVLGLTAGIDSRTALALASASGGNIEAFTYIFNESSALDAALAADLAAAVGTAHWTVPCSTGPMPRNVQEAFASASYYTAAQRIVESMRRFRSDWPVFLSSNLLEIGRAFYVSRNKDHPLPDTPAAATTLYVRLANSRISGRIEKFGKERYRAIVRGAFAAFFEDAQFRGAFEVLDPYDAFYWEHRMGAWHGPLAAQRDVVMDTFIPFNARAVFELMLAVEHDARREGLIFKRMISDHAPALLNFPINPSAWPVAA